MVVENPLNLTEGMEIEIADHTNFNIDQSDPEVVGPIYGRISQTPEEVPDQPTQKIVTVKFYNLLGGGDNPDAGSTPSDGVAAITSGALVKGANGTGTINTVDDFVIAQGLIK